MSRRNHHFSKKYAADTSALLTAPVTTSPKDRSFSYNTAATDTSVTATTAVWSQSSLQQQQVSVTSISALQQQPHEPKPQRLYIADQDIKHVRAQEINTIVQYYQQRHRSGGSLTQPQLLSSLSTSSVSASQQQHFDFSDTTAKDNSTHSQTTFLIVTGPTGCDKSKVVHYALYDLVVNICSEPSEPVVADALTDDDIVSGCTHPVGGGYYITGTFDNTILEPYPYSSSSHDDPYGGGSSSSSSSGSAFHAAMTDLVQQVLHRNKSTSSSSGMIEQIRDAIVAPTGGCDEHELAVVLQRVPSLRTILEYGNKQDDNRVGDIHDKNDTLEIIGAVQTSDTGLVTSIEESAHRRTRMTDDGIVQSHLPRWDDSQQQNRFVSGIQKVLRAISSIGPTPIVLLLENLHYADPSSVDVLCHLLNNLHTSPNVYIIGTYVGNQLDPDDPHQSRNICSSATLSLSSSSASSKALSYFVERILDLGRLGTIVLQAVPIRALQEDQVKYLINQTLHRASASSSSFDLPIIDDDDEICQVVIEQTHGNVFLMNEFLQWLQHRGLLKMVCPPNCQSSLFAYWTWNMDDIYPTISAASTRHGHTTLDTKFYIASKLEVLPTLMVDMLKVAACRGTSYIDVSFIELVLNCSVETILLDAIDLGILVPVSNSQKQFAFINDEMKNAAYHLIPENNREIFHLEIGRRLWRRLDRNEMNYYVFVILSQLRIGRRLILRKSEQHNIAALCLHAGQKAAKSSNFRVALVYFKFGIELLGDDGWRDEYDVSLMIHNAAAEMEMCNSNFEGMELLVASVMRNVRCTEDALQAKTTQLHGYLVNNQQQEGLDFGKQLLSGLGFGLPKRYSIISFWLELNEIKRMLKGKNNDYLKRLPLIADEKVLASMHILNLVSTITFLGANQIPLIVSPNLSDNPFCDFTDVDVPAYFNGTYRHGSIHRVQDDCVDAAPWIKLLVTFGFRTVRYALYFSDR
jgi:predicted ATPase